MLNPKDISIIVNSTMKKMGIVEPALERLIKGTFVMQSNMERLLDYSDRHNKRRGLMLMSEADAREVIGEYIRYRPDDRKRVSEASGVDLFNMDVDEALLLLESNVRFMVAVTVMFYSSHYSRIPDDDLEAIAITYKAYFNEYCSLDTFITKYTETFIG